MHAHVDSMRPRRERKSIATARWPISARWLIPFLLRPGAAMPQVPAAGSARAVAPVVIFAAGPVTLAEPPEGARGQEGGRA